MTKAQEELVKVTFTQYVHNIITAEWLLKFCREVQQASNDKDLCDFIDYLLEYHGLA